LDIICLESGKIIALLSVVILNRGVHLTGIEFQN